MRMLLECGWRAPLLLRCGSDRSVAAHRRSLLCPLSPLVFPLASELFVCFFPHSPPFTMASEGAAVESTGQLTCMSVDLEDVSGHTQNRSDGGAAAGGATTRMRSAAAASEQQQQRSTCRPQPAAITRAQQQHGCMEEGCMAARFRAALRSSTAAL